ncbi:MAG: 2-oxoglutarate dehydrogenase complex dihydrolipoyllysine-residue succinyltransferase [Pseudomonadales bacterium]|nr:2-oxoglutarate dehydrogenase complex dihydrolipoyllysine-residue succinyltransferase [Pseudomonadales bacterium]
MTIEIKAPQFPESVADGVVATWHKQAGEAVTRDELIVDIETDKVVLEVVAPADGVLKEITREEGVTVLSLEVLGYFEAGAAGVAAAEPKAEAVSQASTEVADLALSPAVRKLVAEKDVDVSLVTGTGKGGRITKEDVVGYLKSKPVAPSATTASAKIAEVSTPATALNEREEKRVPMTRLRARIAQRLMQAKNDTAMLTTFNEVNMKPIMTLRKNYKEAFEKEHGVKLGFMGFFVRACVEALKRYPAVNASLDGSDVVYHGFYDVGVAVSTERGLVVPILRDVNKKSLAETEQQIFDYGLKARDGKLSIDDMTGGTFTISNGGVFGSLFSTPILNPPQTAILGMHKIQERPMAVDGKVEILPMMYLAVSYDHRLIDGKDAVQFLVTVKEFVEDPTRLLLEI